MKTLKTFLIISLLLVFTRVNSAIVVINQSGSTFSPKNITVNVGDVIKWVWSGGTHTTTSTTIPQGATSWDAELTSTSTTFEYTVTVAGKYSYVCTIHESMGMVGSFTTSDITSVEESRLNDFKIFPNPASSIVKLPEGLKGKIQLYNILGREVRGLRTSELTGANLDQLDVSDLTHGIYFIGYFPDNTKKRITWRLIKE